MSFRPLLVLCRSLLALLLLVGAAALADAPAAGHAPETGVAQHQASRIQAPVRHDQGRLGEVALDAAWADSDDDPVPLALAPEIVAPVATQTRPVILAAATRATPLSHWPCASTPTGPPRS